MIEEATLVRVTREHIARGKRRDCEKCPIALALTGALGDLLPEGSWAEVGGFRAVVFLPDGETWVATLPPSARNFVEALDEDDDRIRPFEFSLTWRLVPEEVMP